MVSPPLATYPCRVWILYGFAVGAKNPIARSRDVRNPAEQKTWERLRHPRLSELWGGFFDLGYAMARGNAKTETLTTNFNATRVTRKDKIILNFNQIYSTARVNGLSTPVHRFTQGS